MREDRTIQYRPINDYDNEVFIPFDVEYAVIGRQKKMKGVSLSNAKWIFIAVFTNPSNATAWAKSFEAEQNARNERKGDQFEYKAVQLAESF